MTKNDTALNISCNRLLAKHEVQKDAYQTDIKKQYSGKGMYNAKNDIEGIGPYSHLKRDGLSDLDAYKKSYKKRYSKKNALAKLECYCEKKVFDKIDYIDNLAEKMRNDKKLYKKKIYNKIVYPLIIFAFIPFIGLVIPSFFHEYNPYIKYWCYSGCAKRHGKSDAEKGHTETSYTRTVIREDIWNIITTMNYVFLCTTTVIFLLVIIYFLIKVIKYEKLKEGKEKM